MATLAAVAITGLTVAAVVLSVPRQPVGPENSVADGHADSAAYHPPGSDEFVGSEACAACHQSIAESFQTHPMAHSIERITARDDEVSYGTDSSIEGKGTVFDVHFDDGNMFHRERHVDRSGETIVEQSVPMHYVVGSGRRAKAYLSQRDDLLFMSPLNWYSEAQRWDMAPGYAIDDPRGFDRRVTDACLSCHAGRVASNGRLPNRYQANAFHEAAIGCENCHGPGQRHIAFHSGAEKVTHALQDLIVNPADLDVSRREAICQQCHLQATVRILRPGRSDFDFRPGDRMEDVWAVLDTGSGVDADGRTQSVNHVQQMRDSMCFDESDGRLGCISCHDPHRVPSAAERVDFYRQRCLTCHDDGSCSADHDARQRVGDSCIACHMPGRETHNMSHVTQTDHRVLKIAGAVQPSQHAGPSESLAFFNDERSILPEWEQQRALGIGAWIYLMKVDQRPSIGVAQMLIPIAEKLPRDGMTLLALGSIASLNEKLDLARNYLQTATTVPDAEEEALISLLDLEYGAGRWAEALAAADRLLEINPWRAKTHALRADALSHLGRLDEGIVAAERAVELNPWLEPLREWLINAYRMTGQEQERRAQEDLLRRLREATSAGSTSTNERNSERLRDQRP